MAECVPGDVEFANGYGVGYIVRTRGWGRKGQNRFAVEATFRLRQYRGGHRLARRQMIDKEQVSNRWSWSEGAYPLVFA